MDCAAGAYAASPMPTNARASSSIVNVCTWLVKIVAKLQKITPPAMMRERLNRSAKNPKGMLARARTACRDDLQVADLRAAEREFVAYQGNERRNGLAIGEVDKVDQSKYSKKTNLIGT